MQPGEAGRPVAVISRASTTRLIEVPCRAWQLHDLATDGKRLYFLSHDASTTHTFTLKTFPINNKNPEPETFQNDVRSYELSLDSKKLLVRTAKDLYVVDAGAKAPDRDREVGGAVEGLVVQLRSARRLAADVRRSVAAGARLLLRPRHARRRLAGDARQVRAAGRSRHRSQRAGRRRRADGGELSALHIFVRRRRRCGAGADEVAAGIARRRLERDEQRRRLSRRRTSTSPIPICRTTSRRSRGPASTSRKATSSQPSTASDAVGAATSASCCATRRASRCCCASSPRRRRRARRRRQPIRSTRETTCATTSGSTRGAWRSRKRASSQIGYVHLRAMGGDDIAQWERELLSGLRPPGPDHRRAPQQRRQHRQLDSREAAAQGVVLLAAARRPADWNMQYAFRGHMVVLCDEFTASDGEAFAEGFRRLGLGKVIGTRTWGGEIWLSPSNGWSTRHRDGGRDRRLRPGRRWLIEGHGVDPDIVVDNLPHATFKGEDAQLERRDRVPAGADQKIRSPCRLHRSIRTRRSGQRSGNEGHVPECQSGKVSESRRTRPAVPPLCHSVTL